MAVLFTTHNIQSIHPFLRVCVYNFKNTRSNSPPFTPSPAHSTLLIHSTTTSRLLMEIYINRNIIYTHPLRTRNHFSTNLLILATLSSKCLLSPLFPINSNNNINYLFSYNARWNPIHVSMHLVMQGGSLESSWWELDSGSRVWCKSTNLFLVLVLASNDRQPFQRQFY